MPYPRHILVDETQAGIYHCINRCVRRAFLCGFDPVSGNDYEHRKRFIQQRLEELAGLFAVEVLSFAVMSNHLHVILRIRPDIAATWDPSEVQARWRKLYPAKPLPGAPDIPLAIPALINLWRERLSSLSWFMRCLCEPVARRSNREDRCKGRFWEGRFKSQKLSDEQAVLACSLYVDLNPIRSGVAETPETSQCTSAYERIADYQAASKRKGEESDRAGWLAPVPYSDKLKQSDTEPKSARRASHQGFLSISLEEYLQLLDWVGRELRMGKSGSIPAHLAPILERLNVKGSLWVDCVESFGKWFKHVAGSVDRIRSEAHRIGKRWFQGIERAKAVFGWDRSERARLNGAGT